MSIVNPRASRLSGSELAATVNRAAKEDVPSVDHRGGLLPSTVAGVVFARLTMQQDDRGSLMALPDEQHPFWIEPIVHTYAFTVRPGRIKGWGMHRRQTDRYFVTRGSLRVVLFDGREDSVSCGEIAEFFFTDATPGLLRIPAGVWHADHNWGNVDAQVINFPTERYNPDEPDKLRIDPHAGIIPFDWRLRDR